MALENQHIKQSERTIREFHLKYLHPKNKYIDSELCEGKLQVTMFIPINLSTVINSS